jgi:hypothetical protein
MITGASTWSVLLFRSFVNTSREIIRTIGGSGLMNLTQKQITRGRDAAHFFGIAAGIVRARCVAKSLHQHLMGKLFDRLLMGISDVRRRFCPWPVCLWPARCAAVGIPWMEYPGVTVNVL